MSDRLPPPEIHTPYDGKSKPFTVGARPLDPDQWVEVDDNLLSYLAEKERLYREIPDRVMAAEEETLEAQVEVLTLLADYLPKHFPEIYQRKGEIISILGGQRRVDLQAAGLSPLSIAGKLVQEDLLLMRRSQAGWRLAAATLCFPSAWKLQEKFGKLLHQVHQPVPGFGEGTRNAVLIERMFDNLRPEQPMMRWNWSLHGNMRLYHPDSHHGPGSRFGDGDIRNHVILRLERQTLRKLPKSGDILFTVRIHLNPLEILESLAEGPELALAINDQLQSLSLDEAAYKGITNERERLAQRLGQIAKGNHNG